MFGKSSDLSRYSRHRAAISPASFGPMLRGPSGRPSSVATGITPSHEFVKKISSAFSTSSRRKRFSVTFRRLMTHSRTTPSRHPDPRAGVKICSPWTTNTFAQQADTNSA